MSLRQFTNKKHGSVSSSRWSPARNRLRTVLLLGAGGRSRTGDTRLCQLSYANKEGDCLADSSAISRFVAIALLVGAGRRNRTAVMSLEGSCSTIELHPLGAGLSPAPTSFLRRVASASRRTPVPPRTFTGMPRNAGRGLIAWRRRDSCAFGCWRDPAVAKLLYQRRGLPPDHANIEAGRT